MRTSLFQNRFVGVAVAVVGIAAIGVALLVPQIEAQDAQLASKRKELEERADEIKEAWAKYEDPSFYRYVDLRRFREAWANEDTVTLTDLALQLQMGERELLRQHKGITADTLTKLVVALAEQKGDRDSLTRIEKAAGRDNKEELQADVRRRLPQAIRALAASPQERKKNTKGAVSAEALRLIETAEAFNTVTTQLSDVKQQLAQVKEKATKRRPVKRSPKNFQPRDIIIVVRGDSKKAYYLGELPKQQLQGVYAYKAEGAEFAFKLTIGADPLELDKASDSKALVFKAGEDATIYQRYVEDGKVFRHVLRNPVGKIYYVAEGEAN